MEVEKREAQFKMSQNKPIEDRKHITSVLSMSASTIISEMGKYMQRMDDEANEAGA